MNTNKSIFSIALTISFFVPGPVALAGSVAGFGGGTEVTQIMNNIELVQSNAQLLKTFQNQLQQYDTMLQNLAKNPTSALSGDTARLVNGIGKIMDATQSMGNTMARIDQRFGDTFSNNTAKSFAARFTDWSSTSQSTLKSAMLAAGSHRDQFGSETDALSALFNKTQSSQGNAAALQTLGEINVEAALQTMKLRDLMSSQAIAGNTYMMEQQKHRDGVIESNGNAGATTFNPELKPSGSRF